MSFFPPEETDVRGAAFGDLRQRGRNSQELSFASYDAAASRLRRAFDSLADDREEEADKWLRRAASMPFDTFERLHPALAAASVGLHDIVHEAMEVSDDERQPEWLVAAERAAASGGAPYLLGSLEEIAEDYELTPPEMRALTQLLRAHAAERPPFGTPELTVDEVLAVLRDVAADVVAFGRACEELGLLVRD